MDGQVQPVKHTERIKGHAADEADREEGVSTGGSGGA